MQQQLQQTEKKNLVGFWNIIAYGVGDIFGGGSFVLIGLLFMNFLTDVVEISASHAGLIVMLGKGWDAISDPLMGYISDRTRTRFGRRRIFFLIGIIPIGLSFFLLWLPVGFDSELLRVIYFVAAYMMFSTVFTMVMVPYSALNAEITRDYRIRTKLTGARMIFSGLSSLIVAVVPRMIVSSYEDINVGYRTMGIICSIFFMVPWIFVFLGTRESIEPEEPETNERFSLKSFARNIASLLENRSFRIHLGMYICAYSAIDILMAIAVYYMTYYFNRIDLFPWCVGGMMVAQLGSLIGYVYLSNKFGKGRAYIIGLIIWGIAMVAVLFAGRDVPNHLVIMNFVLVGLGMSAGAMIPWAILPSVTDVDEMITSKKRAGTYAGAMTLIRKFVQAIVLFVIGIMLDWIEYQPNVEQTDATLRGMQYIFCFGPITFIAIGILFATRFSITPKVHALMMDEIKRISEGGKKESVTESAKAVCEKVSGKKYETLFPSTKK